MGVSRTLWGLGIGWFVVALSTGNARKYPQKLIKINNKKLKLQDFWKNCFAIEPGFLWHV